ncbi:hypothetical protein AMELA_G00232710 [Ameiurus melas]|uniref:Uncharacterized protein n=1 Tax=Ameiurus melas TaxID=219545 RepID=A0A7J5ZXR6_AMEME|nr:hypothetical protein AMELA_G00232710 [Ameiurus melas]
MAVEVVNGDLPRAPTCFCILRLPGHYKDYQSFRMDLIMCIGLHWIILIIQQLELHISSLAFTLSLLPYSCSVNVSVLL